jgi:ELWxxDGT repeat protein
VVSDIPGKEAFFTPGGLRNLPLTRTSLPGRLLFQAWDPAHDVELWASDGTPQGTRLVRDVCPGPCPGVDHILLPNQGLFYFAGSDGTHGQELWASDGTPEGTRMVREICPGTYGSLLYAPSRFAGRLLFAADDCVNSLELWTTDGTAAGTVRATDFARYITVDAFLGAVAGGRFLFAGDDDEHGSEPWSTDGTIAGAALVEDIDRADLGGSTVSGIRSLGDEAVFFADDGLHGFELWKSDGTPAGAAGTSLVAELSPGPGPRDPPGVVASAEAGGELFLLLRAADGLSLWRTDGTAAGTIELLGPEAGLWDGSGLYAAGGRVFFTAYDGGFVQRLWATDGSVAGTRQVGESFSNPIGLTELDGKLYFFALGSDSRQSLWRTDGTAATALNTVQVKSFGYETQPVPAVHAGRLWFFVRELNNVALWSSDGTAAGTRSEPLLGLPEASFMASIGSKLLISGYVPGSGIELWATDGTPEGTRKVGPAVFTRGARSFPWTVFQGRLVYAAVDEAVDNSLKLWMSDGTPEGTGPLLDRDGKRIPPPVDMAVLGDHLIFTLEALATPAQVWQSDGTPEGTMPLAPERPIGLNTGAVGRAGDRVFFGAWEPATGQELWAVEEGHP